ncbi:hypothetical protein GCM10008904_09190 [Paraclostridium ghonii]|uniref:CRISPR/Cas system-associated exonuclease Cas4 (RecB family) n=1 Tax=Paraclostridium ghonii TaxID=29358 RepID=A0ABU0N211_9FIRM|nr:DUF5711 family protein [Paeniclostridium ghonii]MDQ0557206.1 CRISPR/Cas system-associated exonuclease Cas4 (RecB family) [Paeniclostridium ghonii]
MKKKWLLIILLLIIVLINPKTMGIISKKIGKKPVQIKDKKSIEISEKFNCIEYENNLVYYDGKCLKSIDENGKEIFKIDLNIKNINLESNKYIDILDKDKNSIFSIDKNGKIIFKKNVPNNGLMYVSSDNDSYIYGYKKEDKDMVNIYDFEGNLQKSIELEGKLTDIEYSSKGIYICDLKTEKNLGSTVNHYDYNGNVKDKKIINDSIVLDSIMQKDNMYLIEKNKISILDSNLKTINELKLRNIKLYSNLDSEGMYVVEENNKIKYIGKETKDISTSSNIEYIDGIVNTKDSFILYKDNKIINKKGEELKSFEKDIKKITLINDSTLGVELENKIQILKIN